MLFSKQNEGVRRSQNTHPAILLPLAIVIIAIAVYFAPKGRILILENPNGIGFTMDFKEWSSKNKCTLALNKGDVLQIEVLRKDGEIALVVVGRNGSEPYTGKNLRSGLFTVTVSETDEYDIRITGKAATGKIVVKNLGTVAK